MHSKSLVRSQHVWCLLQRDGCPKIINLVRILPPSSRLLRRHLSSVSLARRAAIVVPSLPFCCRMKY